MSSDDDPPESQAFSRSDLTAVVLAAGRGQRLQSDTPKPIFPICGRAMASHVLHACAEAGIERAVVVIPSGERGEGVESVLRADAPPIDLRFAVQEEPRGTAHAVMCARDAVRTQHVFVANGDLPLLSAKQIVPLLDTAGVDAVIATATVNDPANMGRIIRASDGALCGIVEFREASDEQRQIQEVNLGLYRFRAEFLWDALERIVTCAEGEAYATAAVPMAVARGSALAVEVPLRNGRLNVETPSDASDAESLMQRRIITQLLADGVHIRDRNAVWIDSPAEIEPGAVIEPGTHVRGRSRVGRGARLGPNAIVDNAVVGTGAALESCTVRESVLAENVEVGPYSTVRPGCEIGARVHIGTHAELKSARIGNDVQIGHFSYVGDAVVGARTNIGAGAVTCNFDGEDKHQTIIGEDAFIGSDTMLIAPVRIGDRARTAAGSVVNKDVPDDGNAVGHPARLIPSLRSRTRKEPPA